MAITYSALGKQGRLGNQVEQRFWNGVDVRGPDECWPWMRSTFHFGHGQFKVDGKNLKAHRVAYFITNGQWPNPCGRHTCDNPQCCNPSHIVAGTQIDNIQDRETRQRTARKLTDMQVAEMRDLYSMGDITQAELAEKFGVHNAFVSRVVNQKRRAT